MASSKASTDRIDVLVITALRAEFTAARAAGRPGVERWEERDGGGPAPYLRGVYRAPNGRRLSVALARPLGMGGRSTAPMTTSLVERLRPYCLAMSGVCAGNPAVTALGDVVVADVAYEWDEGRFGPAGFEGQHQQIALAPRWVRAAQDLDPAGLPSYGPATADEAMLWLLERLHRGQDPRRHPARERYFPSGSWQRRLRRYEVDGLITRADETVTLTRAGERLIRRRLYDDVDGPHRLPFRVVTAPVASGSAVIKDASIWPRLAAMGMRKVAAVEMEAATVATVARDLEVPRWLVVKGVMDHADLDKDDRYKRFAAKASAEVMYALLAGLVPGRAGVGSAVGGGAAGVQGRPPAGLVDVTGGRVIFGAAVSRIAESLSPLGAAGRHVAESYVLNAEMRRIAREDAQDKEIKLALLERRREESSATLRQMRQELGRADKSAQVLRECMADMQRRIGRPGLTPEELVAEP